MVLRIPRHACSPRDRCRSGDLWRIVQEVAIRASAEAGWPPSRYRALGTGFVVRELVGVHHREATYDESLRAETWIREARRSLLLHRVVRIADVLDTAVQWVHIGANGGISQASPELMASFPVHPEIDAPDLPFIEAQDPVGLPPFMLTPWWTEMDPLGHTNHPRYVDWADEALSVWLARRNIDPVGIVPVAERLRFTSAARAGDLVTVQLTHVGWSGEAAAFKVRIHRASPDPHRHAPREHEASLCEGTIVRAHLAGSRAFA